MKILLAIDATRFCNKQLEFPLHVAALMQGEVTAIFLENWTQVFVSFSKYGHLPGYELSDAESTSIRKEIIEQHIASYVQACEERKIAAVFLRARRQPVEETIKASRFADLLLIAPDLSFESSDENIPTKFAEEVLSAAQCPVLVTPKVMREIKEVFFTYNGGFSSVYAIRQFTLLFPSFRYKKVTLLFVSENDDEGIVHKRDIKEYLQRHYEQVEFKLMTGNPSTALLSHLYKQRDCIVTFGAYGRSRIFQFFKKSKADGILKALDIPVFITHH